MTRSTANVATEHASRYLQQLAKHWSHRFEVAFDPTEARIDFGEGANVHLAAAADVLTVSIEKDGTRDIETLETVVADHLKRFAFREELQFDWTRSTGDAPN
ncbi:DUF2218 domain-containing protein [Roseicyclus sp. F158]|uniref:DUF2218 domain-containing protein n=1 Tax=Tropicimonas omnivorans TaxID=3075590 RepID=A0ABU3DKT5_9RHOB|nr:DUF2218 domain-containing protein [Roseicyclus sp. F158]MDT0684323.1 DUF2218 domain-containing protein [Roseicyclus sp. F158]